MTIKKLWVSSTLCLIFTCLWIVLMILSVLKTGTIDTLEEAINSVMKPGILFYLSYINAVFVTITITIFFSCLYYYCKALNEELASIGFIFVPIYSVLNLMVYFSQITVIPRLITLMETSEHTEQYRVILGQFVQVWSDSAISVVNQLAYAILGIPSIIFGTILIKNKEVRTGGWLIALNGLVCIIGVIGTAANNDILAIASVAGGVLFFFALLAIVLSMKPKNQSNLTKAY